MKHRVASLKKIPLPIVLTATTGTFTLEGLVGTLYGVAVELGTLQSSTIFTTTVSWCGLSVPVHAAGTAGNLGVWLPRYRPVEAGDNIPTSAALDPTSPTRTGAPNARALALADETLSVAVSNGVAGQAGTYWVVLAERAD